MSKGTTHTFLLFDAACQTCSRLALEIELETDWMLCARSLREPIMQAWLEQARPGWCWEPTLLEVDGDRSRAFTGLGMAFRLVQVLGLRRAGRVARLVQRASVPSTGMHAERRQFLRYSGGMLLTLLGTSILAACGGSTPSSAPSATSVPSSKVKGEFLAAAPGDSTSSTSHTWVALSTDGQQVIAYTCDGDDRHHVTFAQWFKGNVTNNTVDLTKADGAHLVATFTSRAATGTVTLPTGTSIPFTANAITDPASKAGLYRSEQTLGGVSYLVGWVVATEQALNPLSTPTAFVGGLFASAEERPCPCRYCCKGGAIINEQTKQLLSAPNIEQDNVTSGHVVVPNLGTFALTQCRNGQCS